MSPQSPSDPKSSRITRPQSDGGSPLEILRGEALTYFDIFKASHWYPLAKPLESRRGQGRLAAMRFLYEWELNPENDLETAFQLHLHYMKLKTGVAGYARKLIEGSIAHREQIDRLISENLTNWTLDRLALVDLTTLRIGVHEMLFVDEVPHRVTINEMVEVAKNYGSSESASFVNGVLDGIRKKLGPDKAAEKEVEEVLE